MQNRYNYYFIIITIILLKKALENFIYIRAECHLNKEWHLVQNTVLHGVQTESGELWDHGTERTKKILF